MRLRGVRLTVKDRILVHLLESASPGDEVEAPLALTQYGVSRGAGVEVRHLSQSLRPLIREGLVRERTSHVAGRRQRMRVYGLTPSGSKLAVGLRERIRAKVVLVRDNGALREVPLGQVLRGVGATSSLLRVVRQIDAAGVLDLEQTLSLPESGRVEQLTEAPHVIRFFGRRGELAELSRLDVGPRVFVVRGIAGIGKSTLAARACELVRGQRNLLWHRIRAWESDLTVLATLGQFLERLDRPGLSSVLKRGDSGLIREVLRQDLPDTHAFVVLDDAHEASGKVLEVLRMLTEAAVSAPDVRILVLTRRALRFYGVRDVVPSGIVREIELGGLRPEEAAAFLAAGRVSEPPAGLGRRLAGHPLFLELIGACQPDTVRGLQDVQRFIEEEMYARLSDSERSLMKANCLYGVPVPQAVILSAPRSSFDAFLALRDHSLIRSVGGDRYGLHDTVRDFFRGTLSPAERRAYGDLAVEKLQTLASAAAASGDTVACVEDLSNALVLARSPTDRGHLSEALGDAESRIGDTLGCMVAYRQALGLAKRPEILARLHRKLARVDLDQGEIEAADREIDAGWRALGNIPSVERGWLDLLRAKTSELNWEDFRSEASARRALSTFEQYGDVPGQARAWLLLADASDWTGSVTRDGTRVSDQAYASALRMAEGLEDPEFEAEVHIMMAQSAGLTSGAYADVARHLAAVQGSPKAWSDSLIRAKFYHLRALLLLRLEMDLDAAQADVSELERLAEKLHDVCYEAHALTIRGSIASLRGKNEEAWRLRQAAAERFLAVGMPTFASNAYSAMALDALAAGDVDGFRRAASAARVPGIPSKGIGWTRRRVVDAFSALLDGNADEFEKVFGEVFGVLDGYPRTSGYQQFERWAVEFYYGLGLRSTGHEAEAREHIARARQFAESANQRNGLYSMGNLFAANIVSALCAVRPPPVPAVTASRSASARGSPTPSTSRRSSGRPGSRGGTSGRAT